MKLIMMVLTLILVQTAFAQIENSNYEKRHQVLIENSVRNKCSVRMGNLTQLSSVEETVQVDQGVRDTYFSTVLQGFYRIDQGQYDEYEITVRSVRFEAYDHDAQSWGQYSVDSVQCVMK